MKTINNLLILIAAAFLIVYFSLPVVNYGFTDLALLLIVLTGLWILLNRPIHPNSTPQEIVFQLKSNKVKGPVSFMVVLGLYMTVLPMLTSLAVFRSNDYRDLIGKVEVGESLSDHMAPISIEKIRVVDQALANLLGDKVLGAQAALGSQVRLGTFNIQKVGTELYWVAPLLHSGFFMWQKNSQGTPGYVMVNATNERDVKLVQEVKGKKVLIKYQPEAFFFSNLERHTYFEGYFTCGLTDYSFEIDDDGNPFWVITKFKKKIGFNGSDAVGVVIVDPQTGETKDYSIENTPAWVDRIQPDKFIETQLNDWGQYVKGYWNFSNQDKLQITESVSLVYGEDNRAYWYTGLTSVGADEATVGFVLVDTRTKKAVWYRQSGATEFAAKNSAIGKIQEKRYSASAPIPYNINGIPTYVMTLKDDGGLVKMFAMVAIEDYTIVGVGNTLRETLMAYKNAFNMTSNKLNTKNTAQKTTLKSIVTRINNDVKNGNSFYYFTVKDYSNIFIGSSQISNALPVSSVGDSIEISFDSDTQGIIDISTFKNMTIKK
ncbi:cell shape-determining protein [Aquipluma nitroreducens]|uniref:Cell shape-determining protein n=1 Tax=Aquipluma nitroreducens TaxID=2010828 RepID=A0A5K7SBW9_9BACT|nr:hypothetical protein [Aquipluma nitroreducens]BBE19058.1 cell shape-determining protein [Aquipluma nitroreducens]